MRPVSKRVRVCWKCQSSLKANVTVAFQAGVSILQFVCLSCGRPWPAGIKPKSSMALPARKASMPSALNTNRNYYTNASKSARPTTSFAMLQLAMPVSTSILLSVSCWNLSCRIMGGFEVLVKLVPLAQHPEIPVIILTRFNFMSLMQLARLNGAYRCLYKSMSSGDLLNSTILQATSAVRRDPKRASLPPTSPNLDRAA